MVIQIIFFFLYWQVKVTFLNLLQGTDDDVDLIVGGTLAAAGEFPFTVKGKSNCFHHLLYQGITNLRFHRLFCVAVAVSFVVELWFHLPSSWLQLIAWSGKVKILSEPFLFTFQWNERLSVFFDKQCSCVFHQYIAGDSQHLVGKRWNWFWSQKCQQISFASKLQFCDESIY